MSTPNDQPLTTDEVAEAVRWALARLPDAAPGDPPNLAAATLRALLHDDDDDPDYGVFRPIITVDINGRIRSDWRQCFEGFATDDGQLDTAEGTDEVLDERIDAIRRALIGDDADTALAELVRPFFFPGALGIGVGCKVAPS